ncbi:MAG: xanthine dehydrogenase small subunit [Ignavibacteriae bacterium]|nr:xanthine dehydrogenase small subunit [Ignavibacteriota bacterium]
MISSVTFFHNGKLKTIDFSSSSRVTPTTTVLNWLRSLPDFKGTKEGCAEGDCGACTVVLGELSNDGTLRYKSVDSCLVFLPMLHGKQLLTVESLKNEAGELHPVQQAMVDEHGSQCGYCTPGFVMSLFSLYKNQEHPTKEQIEDSLTGNLCRCTGYRPIVQAAATACIHRNQDEFAYHTSHIAHQLENISKTSIHIQTPLQTYIKPASLGEAITLKHQHPDAIVISGATDIALRVTKRHELLKEIIDVSDVPELKEYSENELSVSIGAGLSLNDIMQNTKLQFPALFEILSVFGSQQIRNLATLGGNLGTASPISDMLPVLMAYNANIVLEGINGRREISLDNFITGYRQTVRKPDELITAVIIPKIMNGAVVKSYKISKRRDLDISTVSAGFRLELNGNNEVTSIKLVYGGMAERTKRSETVEKFLLGKIWNRETVEQAMSFIDKEFTPISDARASAEYRRAVAKNLLMKFWSKTLYETVGRLVESKTNEDSERQ